MNNHLGDANKMVSETPISESTPHNVADLGMLCRRIKRELNAANDRIKRLEEAGDYLCAAAAFMGWHDKIEAWTKAKEAKL